MKPVMQTSTGPRGNCMSACLASIFEVDIRGVPNFFDVAGDDAGPWWQAIRNWLKPRGFGVLTLTFDDAALWDQLCLGGYHIVSGKSPRIEGAHHSTVWHQGRMVHDPHPDQTGILKPETLELIYPLDPANAEHLRALWREWEEGLYDGRDLLRRVRVALYGSGPRRDGSIGLHEGRS